jgi:hypothetical protein
MNGLTPLWLFALVYVLMVTSGKQPAYGQTKVKPKEITMGQETPPATVEQYTAIFHSPPARVPTDAVPDGPLLGNGDVGVTQSGRPEAQRFWLSKCDLWKARDRRYPEGSPCLLGGLDIQIPALHSASYRVEQHIAMAETVSTFQTPETTVSMRAWVAATENSIFIELSSTGKPVDVELKLWPQTGHGAQTEAYGLQRICWITRKFNGQDLLWPTEAAAALRLPGASGPKFTLTPEQPVTLAVAICTSHENKSYQEEARSRATRMTDKKVATIRARHRRWWNAFWSRSSIRIGDPLLEKFWYGSHYLMACCSRNRAFPPGLFGNWITTDTPSWAGDYHLNYNYQAPWWGVYSSNHVDIADPYDTPLLEYIPPGQDNARNLLRCRGIYYEVGIGPKGLNTSQGVDDAFWGQKSNAAYAAINMILRWRATYDRDYLKTCAYPFLKEVGNFWEDYLRREGGRYVILNDSIHEGSGPDKNALLSLGLVRAVFTALLEMSADLKVDVGLRARWRDIVNHLSPFPLQQRDGMTVFRYSEVGMAWSDGNTLGIQHIWPVGAIGLDSDPKLLQIARNTITALHRWEDGNGFPTFYTAAARVGYDPEVILSHLREQCLKHGYPNLFIYYGGGGIECCSGVPSCLNEMLMQSHENVLRLFPDWPLGRDAGFTDLRADGAFLVSSELKAGKVQFVRIHSEKGRLCVVENPWPGKSIIVTEEKGTQPVLIEWNGSRFQWKTRRGVAYRIELE